MIIGIGDVHGKFEELFDKLKSIDFGFNVNFIQVGDFGVGFDHPQKDYDILSKIDAYLNSINSHMWIIRGNHDNPAFWRSESGYMFKNMHFVRDNTYNLIDNKLIFFSGGGVSVDRHDRQLGCNYWYGERIALNTNALQQSKINLLVTHDVYNPIANRVFIDSDIVNDFSNVDINLKTDLLQEQKKLEVLYNFFALDNDEFQWIYGHYHDSCVSYVDKKVIRCLNELEFKQIF